MRDKDDVYEAKGCVCLFHMIGKVAEDNVENKSGFMSNSECVVEEWIRVRQWHIPKGSCYPC